MADKAEIMGSVKDHILEKLLPGEDPSSLTEETPLITGGILDSISTVTLVAFLEEKFGVEFAAHEMSADYFDSLSDIADTVQDKMS